MRFTFVSIPSSLWFFCKTCWRASWIFCWSFSTFTFSWSQDRSGGNIVTTVISTETGANFQTSWMRFLEMHEGQLLYSMCVCVCDWHLPADINTKAENRAISSSDRCIEHKFFPNSKTELIKSSQPATAKDREKGRRMSESKEQHSLLIFIGREAHREGRRRGRDEKGAACWQHMGAS